MELRDDIIEFVDFMQKRYAALETHGGVAPKLDPDFKTWWIDTLLGGEFPQARNELFHPGTEGPRGFCCLGVAMLQHYADHIYGGGGFLFTKEWLDVQPQDILERMDADKRRNDGSYLYQGEPPQFLREEWGMVHEIVKCCVSLNDGTALHLDGAAARAPSPDRQCSFKEIAYVIKCLW